MNGMTEVAAVVIHLLQKEDETYGSQIQREIKAGVHLNELFQAFGHGLWAVVSAHAEDSGEVIGFEYVINQLMHGYCGAKELDAGKVLKPELVP